LLVSKVQVAQQIKGQVQSEGKWVF
jgi:hypothetical protein